MLRKIILPGVRAHTEACTLSLGSILKLSQPESQLQQTGNEDSITSPTQETTSGNQVDYTTRSTRYLLHEVIISRLDNTSNLPNT